MRCFECGEPAEHQHHVIPRALGGTQTVPLCGRCHGLVHDAPLAHTSRLTKAGMARQRAEGKNTGGEPPYGFAREVPGSVYLVEVPDEQAVIADIRRLHAARLTHRQIAATLTEAGRRMRSGRPIGPGLVQRVLARSDASRV